LHMRYGYWIDAILGLVLIVSPYVGRFTQDHTAFYADMAVGMLLVLWAIVSYPCVAQVCLGMGAVRSLPRPPGSPLPAEAATRGPGAARVLARVGDRPASADLRAHALRMWVVNHEAGL
jgi:hypothetical protein